MSNFEDHNGTQIHKRIEVLQVIINAIDWWLNSSSGVNNHVGVAIQRYAMSELCYSHEASHSMPDLRTKANYALVKLGGIDVPIPPKPIVAPAIPAELLESLILSKVDQMQAFFEPKLLIPSPQDRSGWQKMNMMPGGFLKKKSRRKELEEMSYGEVAKIHTGIKLEVQEKKDKAYRVRLKARRIDKILQHEKEQEKVS